MTLTTPIPLKPLSAANLALSHTPPSVRYHAFPLEAVSAAGTIGTLGATLARTVGRVATIHSPAEAQRIVARLKAEIELLEPLL